MYTYVYMFNIIKIYVSMYIFLLLAWPALPSWVLDAYSSNTNLALNTPR